MYRDGELSLTWTDSTPLTSGSYIGLRTINTRARFDDVQANEIELSYLHSDHLGSNSLMTDATGAIISNSQAAYLPFGDWRNEPATSTLTDVGYTGHRHNNTASNDLGLIYMNARYYVPSLARFASADTIIPDPTSPQTYNRFSYVENSPLILIDPSGHCGVDPYDDYFDYECWQQYNAVYDQFLANNILDEAILALIGTGEDYEYKSGLRIIDIYDRYRNCGSDFDCSNDTSSANSDPYATPCTWQYWNDCYEPIVTLEEMTPDAFIFGDSASAAGILAGVVGTEGVYNFNTQQASTFVYGGQGFGVALQADASAYGGLVWNLEDNADYEGGFTTLTLDLGLGPGIQASFFWTTGTMPFTGDTWGFSIGGSLATSYGAGLTGTQTDFYCMTGC